MKLSWKTCIKICICVFVLFLVYTYWENISGLAAVLISSAGTLFVGACLAYVVNILMSFYERKIAPKSKNKLWCNLRRPVCMVLSFATVLLAAALLIRLIVPQLIDCFEVLTAALPGAVHSAYAWLDEHFEISAYLAETSLALPSTQGEWLKKLEEWADVLIRGVGGVMDLALMITKSLVGTLITLFMSLIFAINILAGKERLASQFNLLFKRIFGEGIMGRVQHLLSVANECFRSYIVGQLIEALILGSLCTVGMLIFQLPYALMIGAVIGVSALVPIAGAYIGGAIGAIMIFSVSPAKALGFIVFLIVLQQIEGNLIYPHTVGNTLHLPGIWVLAAVTIGGGVMGVFGMMLFVPLTATAYRLIGEWVHRPGPAAVPHFAASVLTESSDPPQEAPAALPVKDVPAPKPAQPPKPAKKRR